MKTKNNQNSICQVYATLGGNDIKYTCRDWHRACVMAKELWAAGYRKIQVRTSDGMQRDALFVGNRFGLITRFDLPKPAKQAEPVCGPDPKPPVCL